MKLFPVLLLFCLYSGMLPAQQNKAADYGLDTALLPCHNCTDSRISEYFSVGGKYPESSMSLVHRVNVHIAQKHITPEQDGFITFRFTINNDGKVSAFRLYMVDEQYKATRFSQEFIGALYQFVCGLQEWKTKLHAREKPVCYYNYYLSFRCKDGKITSVAP